jgi:hypothetical protein
MLKYGVCLITTVSWRVKYGLLVSNIVFQLYALCEQIVLWAIIAAMYRVSVNILLDDGPKETKHVFK